MNLSIIIPCFNAEQTLADQLTALAEQDFTGSWEVIVVDNGSRDGSSSVAESFRGRLPELVLLSARERQGAGYARNRGAAVARSDFLAFCDADDVVAAGYLQAMFEALTRHRFVACRYEYSRLNETWISRCDQTTELSRGLVGPYAYAGGGSLGIRRTAHDLVGGFDETSFMVLEDADYCIRLQRAGVPLQFAPAAVVHYRWRSTVRGAFRQARSWGRECILLRELHWPAGEPLETPHSLCAHLWRLHRVRTSSRLAQWIWRTGWKVGAIEGWYRDRRSWPDSLPTPTAREPDGTG